MLVYKDSLIFPLPVKQLDIYFQASNQQNIKQDNV